MDKGMPQLHKPKPRGQGGREVSRAEYEQAHLALNPAHPSKK